MSFPKTPSALTPENQMSWLFRSWKSHSAILHLLHVPAPQEGKWGEKRSIDVHSITFKAII